MSFSNLRSVAAALTLTLVAAACGTQPPGGLPQAHSAAAPAATAAPATLPLPVKVLTVDAAAQRLPRLVKPSEQGPQIRVGPVLLDLDLSTSPISDSDICVVERHGSVEIGRACGDPLLINGLITFSTSLDDAGINQAVVVVVDDSVAIGFGEGNCATAHEETAAGIRMYACDATGQQVTVRAAVGEEVPIEFGLSADHAR